MKKGWVVLGTIMQALLALMSFMMAVFMGGGFVNKGDVSDFDIKLLELAIFVLPIICVISAIIVIVKYSAKESKRHYAWYAMPIFAWAIFLMYANTL